MQCATVGIWSSHLSRIYFVQKILFRHFREKCQLYLNYRIVYPKMKMSSHSRKTCTSISLLLNTKEMLVTIDFHSIKETQAGLEQGE